MTRWTLTLVAVGADEVPIEAIRHLDVDESLLSDVAGLSRGEVVELLLSYDLRQACRSIRTRMQEEPDAIG